MRVICTELFFERLAFRWATFDRAPNLKTARPDVGKRRYEPNITVAWLKLDEVEPSGPEWAEASFEDVANFIEKTLLSGPGMERASVGSNLLETILSTEIVVEYSPPRTVPLRELIAGAGKHATGVTLGFAAAGGNPELLMLTVPAGVIIMGTAKGIASGLEESLHKLIKDALSSKRLLKP